MGITKPAYISVARACLWIACGIVFVFANNVYAADKRQQLKQYMQTAAKSLAPAQREALAKIKNEDRRYLATTYYVRAGDSIATRWSWTRDQIATYEQSTEYQETLAEIEKISQRFAADNPKYQLYANVEVRSLEEQLARWQTVRSIGVVAREFRKVALAELAQEAYARPQSDESVNRFREFLVAWRASWPPTLAPPGLSLHGQGRAYDFRIQDLNGQTIAGADSSSIEKVWERKGWTKKLSVAVHAASDKFVGPLTIPREPWHYEYRPGNSTE
jgi:hypothetical protein